MLEFNNNHLFTGFVKRLLHRFNLPKAKVLSYGMILYKDNYYVDANFLYKATTTATFGVDFSSANDTYTDIDAKGNEIQVPYLFKVDRYLYGRRYLNITKNLELNSSLYTPYTHTYLGDYLRFFRDFKHIDLMSMYNCFNSEIGKHIVIESDSYSFVSEDDNFVIYTVPVKFFKEYTIAIDSDTSFELMACIYSNNKVCLQNDNYEFLYSGTYQKIAGSKFNSPFKYSKLKDILIADAKSNILYNQEKNLKLLIKLPKSNKSSIVVLEGDFVAASNQTLNVADFSWEMLNDKLDCKTNWYQKDANGNFVKVIDNNITYYDSNTDKPVVDSFNKGGSYYYLDEDNNQVTITIDGVYYSFLASHLVVNYEVNNTDKKKLYFNNSDFLDEEPTAKNKDAIFIDKSTGMSYLWVNDEYEAMTDQEVTPADIYSRKYNSRMQLLFVNDGTSYPFADKLVGYLIDNVITSDDDIPDNIRRLQKTFYYRKNPKAKPDYEYGKDYVKPYGFSYFPAHAGIWSQDLRDLSYDLMNATNHILSDSFDIIGFVDKDVERVLGDDVSYDKPRRE